MRLLIRVSVVTLAVVIGSAIYGWTYGNVRGLYDGWFGAYESGDLRAVGHQMHFSWAPPRFYCLYRTKDGRAVERSN